jgi:hypothetical protein
MAGVWAGVANHVRLNLLALGRRPDIHNLRRDTRLSTLCTWPYPVNAEWGIEQSTQLFMMISL